MQINVESFEKILKVWYFKFSIEEKNKATYSFLARYSELLEIHEKFKSLNKKDAIPEFPPKKLFGSESEKFVEQRKKGLEVYFNQIVKFKDVLKLNINAWTEYFLSKQKEVLGSNSEQQTTNEENKPVDLSQKHPQEKNTSELARENYKKDNAESVYENYLKKLVFLELKTLKKANYKKKNTAVDPSDNIGAVVILNEEEIRLKEISEFIKNCETVSADIESIIAENFEIDKKKFFSEFSHQLTFTHSVNN